MKNKALLIIALIATSVGANAEMKRDVKFTETTYGVCSKKMSVEVRDGILTSVEFEKGCPGNLNALATLLPGMTVDYIVDKLDDNPCSGAQLSVTSCMDNLVEMLKYHVYGEGEGHMEEIRKQQKQLVDSEVVALGGHICSGCGLCNARFI